MSHVDSVAERRTNGAALRVCMSCYGVFLLRIFPSSCRYIQLLPLTHSMNTHSRSQVNSQTSRLTFDHTQQLSYTFDCTRSALLLIIPIIPKDGSPGYGAGWGEKGRGA